MSLSGAMASAFFKEVADTGLVWTLKDSGGIATAGGTMPFFSSESRARAVINQVSDYSDFEPLRIPITEFRQRWLPGLERDSLTVGLNLYGPGATGHNYTPAEIAEWFKRSDSAES